LESENEKSKLYGDKVSKIDEEIFKLKVDNSQKKDITTFKFVADQFSTTIQNVVKWFIAVLIAVFDPLAVILLLAYNISSNRVYDEEKSESIQEKKDISENKTEQIIVEKIVEKPVEVEKIIEKPVEVEKIVEKPVEVEKIVEKIIEKSAKKSTGTRGMFSF
jgi:hypothetical protein